MMGENRRGKCWKGKEVVNDEKGKGWERIEVVDAGR